MASWGNCDFKQLQKLRENVEKLAQADMQKFCEDVSRELAARLLALVIPRTPVGKKPTLKQLGGDGAKGTVKRKVLTGGKYRVKSFLSREGAILEQYWAGYMGGTLRRGWTAKTEAEAQSGGNASAGATYAQSLEVIKSGDSYQITVTNPVQYASYVEFGHRQKPGRYVPQLGKQLKKAWVPGQYMLTISEKQLQEWMPGHLEKRLEKLLMEVFNVDG